MLWRAWCVAWGHAVDNTVFAATDRACTRCGQPCLRDDGRVIRIGHTLSCFLRHHTYERVGERDAHTEYACVHCGHPLLFETAADPYAAVAGFDKRVRYRCGLFGHHVHRVATRGGGVEYACRCGHSFVHQPAGRRLVRHPLVCVLLGHWVSFVVTRAHFSEYACVNCGHPFLFRSAGAERGREKLVHSWSAALRGG